MLLKKKKKRHPTYFQPQSLLFATACVLLWAPCWQMSDLTPQGAVRRGASQPPREQPCAEYPLRSEPILVPIFRKLAMDE